MKIIKVISCWDCPHKYYSRSEKGIFVGCNFEPLNIIKKSLIIPSWCPLEDYKEADHEAPA